MKILREATPTSPKFMVYSLPGMGKTTLASQMSNSIIIDLEGGANYIKTARTEQITNIEDFKAVMVELWKAPKREFDYIVIDTVDWLVRLMVEDVAGIMAVTATASKCWKTMYVHGYYRCWYK